MSIKTLALWGDSIGRGIAFDEERGRYAVLRNNYLRILGEKEKLNILNHARFGATVDEGLTDFINTQDAESDIVVIEFGGNDCNMPWEAISASPYTEHKARNELHIFEKKLFEFVNAVQNRKLTPLLVTPPPLDAQRFFDWVSKGLNIQNILHFVGDIQHIYRWQERYAYAVHRVAERTRCHVFDLRDVFLAHNDMHSLYCIDGMHPNEKGHQVIAEAIETLLSYASLQQDSVYL